MFLGQNEMHLHPCAGYVQGVCQEVHAGYSCTSTGPILLHSIQRNMRICDRVEIYKKIIAAKDGYKLGLFVQLLTVSSFVN